MTEAQLELLRRLISDARLDHDDEVANGIEAGERADLWDGPEVTLPAAWIEALLAEREEAANALAWIVSARPGWREAARRASEAMGS